MPRRKISASTKSNMSLLKKNSLTIYYITLYFQVPNSLIAKSWVQSKGISRANAKKFYDELNK